MHFSPLGVALKSISFDSQLQFSMPDGVVVVDRELISTCLMSLVPVRVCLVVSLSSTVSVLDQVVCDRLICPPPCSPSASVDWMKYACIGQGYAGTSPAGIGQQPSAPVTGIFLPFPCRSFLTWPSLTGITSYLVQPPAVPASRCCL